ncbi:hypothetical protein ACI65C_010401 [Semiaphis heraclei]
MERKSRFPDVVDGSSQTLQSFSTLVSLNGQSSNKTSRTMPSPSGPSSGIYVLRSPLEYLTTLHWPTIELVPPGRVHRSCCQLGRRNDYCDDRPVDARVLDGHTSV